MRKIYFIICTLFFCSFTFSQIEIDTKVMVSDTIYCQEEVCAIETKQKEFVIAYVDRKRGTDEKIVSYRVSTNHKTNWSEIKQHDNAEYIWTGNPAIAEDEAGNIYLVTMSVDYAAKKAFSKGIFEMTVSKDHGKSWSNWTTIVEYTSKNKGIPDKPSLLAKGNGELYLSYISFDVDSSNIFNTYGKVYFQKSINYGVKWSNPIEIKSDRKWKPTSLIKAILTGTADFGEQGTSMVFHNHEILVSWGAYAGNGIFLSQSTDGGNTFTQGRKIAKSKVDVPVTQLKISNDKWFICYHNAHGLGNVILLESTDAGKTWKEHKIASKASMVTGDIDKEGNFHLIWNEDSDSKRTVNYAFYSNSKLNRKLAISTTKVQSAKYFIGAYQHFLIDSEQEKQAFWIDWNVNNGRLNYTSIKTN